jgi:hypothetical protein
MGMREGAPAPPWREMDANIAKTLLIARSTHLLEAVKELALDNILPDDWDV